MKIEYLLFDLCIFCFSTLGVFLYKKAIWPKFFPSFIAFIFVCVPYLFWDQIVTGSWWSFNQNYTLGIRLGRLPIEEILFFVAVPWSCLILWLNIRKNISGTWFIEIEKVIAVTSLILAAASVQYQLWYSLSVSGLLFTLSVMSSLNNHWLNKKSVTVFLSIVILLTAIFNSYLTARPVVMYNAAYLSQLKVGTVPVEDFGYGVFLLATFVIVYEKFEHKKIR